MAIEDIGRPAGEAASLERPDILQQAAEQRVEKRLAERSQGEELTVEDVRAELVTTEARRLRLWGVSVKIVDDLIEVRDALRAAIDRDADIRERARQAVDLIDAALAFHVNHRGKL
jgi:hypothetical protein